MDPISAFSQVVELPLWVVLSLAGYRSDRLMNLVSRWRDYRSSEKQ